MMLTTDLIAIDAYFIRARSQNTVKRGAFCMHAGCKCEIKMKQTTVGKTAWHDQRPAFE
jgi:hypothetical protein